MGSILAMPRRKELGKGWSLRLLPACEEMEVRREGEILCGEDGDRALCMNACLVARVLERRGRPVFESGARVLEQLSVGQIDHLAREWMELDRAWDPKSWDEEAVEQAKKVWSTPIMSAFSGACSRHLGRFRPRRESGT